MIGYIPKSNLPKSDFRNPLQSYNFPQNVKISEKVMLKRRLLFFEKMHSISNLIIDVFRPYVDINSEFEVIHKPHGQLRAREGVSQMTIS